MTARDIPIFKRPGSSIWHLRRTIPTKLRTYFPLGDGRFKSELSPLSLGTRDEKAALKAAVVPWADHRAMLDGLTRGRVAVGTAKRFFGEVFAEEAANEVATVASLKAKIAELEERIEIGELKARTGTTTSTSERLRAATLERDRRELVALKEAFLKNRRQLVDVPTALADPQIAQPVLDEYLAGFVARHPQAVNDGERGLLHQVIHAEAGAAYGKIGQALNEPALVQATRSSKNPPVNATELTPTTSVLEYYREHFRTGRKLRAERGGAGISPDGMDKVKEGARDFADIMGDPHIAAVTSNDVRQFRSVLRRVPKSWRNRTANKSKPLRQLVIEADAEEARTGEPVPRLHPKTVDSTLTGLRSLFKFACDEGHLVDNPARGVTEEIPTDRTHDTDFKIADLNKLFASPWFTGAISEDNPRKPGNVVVSDHRYWAFLCMLFSGARVSEIGGIRTDQVHILEGGEDEETWGYFEFDWTYGAHGRRTKNTSSNRVVPIHRELIKLGFIEYLKEVREAEHERLFPAWVPQNKRIDDGLFKNDYSSAAFLKQFARYLTWLGIKRPGISIKSFRASWETATVGKNIDERALLKITGRRLGGELPNYVGSRGIAEQLRASVDQVTYVGLNISHLYRAQD